MEAKEIRLYPNLVKVVIAALQQVFTEDFYVSKVIERTLKSNPKWGSRDRAFIAENVYEMVRWYRLLYEIDGRLPQREEDWWRLFGILQIINGKVLPTWKEFQGLNPDAILTKEKAVKQERKIKESIPDWLDELGSEELGAVWPETMTTLNRRAEVVLRVNALKANAIHLKEALHRADIAVEPIAENAVKVIKRKNLFATMPFKKGWFEVQDFSSQQVAPFLEVEPGMRVIDACAGGGGKTLHLATLMENKGQVIALDTESWKLDELRRRARRNGIHIIETRPITTTKVIKRLRESADRVLLDVPCSGLGVLRRNPDAKWKLKPEFIDRIRATQQEIIQSYSRMVKPGGKMVYATCSILPSENGAQVAKFLEKNPGEFELIRENTILPQDEGYDGFYMALLQKKG